MQHRYDKTFYNAYYLKNQYRVVEEHSHHFLHDHVLKFLRKDERFVDLGCGDGAFMVHALNQGYSPVVGIDFSSVAINHALDHVRRMGDKGWGKLGFIQTDITELPYTESEVDTSDVLKERYKVIKALPPFETYVLLEVMEHLPLDKDLVMVQKLMYSGKRIVFSVPNFDSISHARYFKSIDQVVDRYKPDEVHEYKYPPLNLIYYIGIYYPRGG